MKIKPFFYVLYFALLITNNAISQEILAEYSIKNLNVNTKHSDYGATFFGANKIYFASSKVDASSLGYKIGKITNSDDIAKYDLYKGSIAQNGEIVDISKVMNQFVTKYNESNASFSNDLRHVYFTQNNIKDGKYIEDDQRDVNMKIYRADVQPNGEWTSIISLPFNSDKYSCAHPAVSEDNKILFFSSDMPGTFGQSDIYWVTINDDGSYGKPQNIGKQVNSRSRENFPYIDGYRLYFSSDRKGTSGGLDIFMIKLDEPDAVPVNLGVPLNSAFDDFCFVLDRQNKRGFFSSNRPGGKGGDDIYYFTQDTEFKECKQTIFGSVFDKNLLEPIAGAIVSLYSHDNIFIASKPANDDGEFTFELACRGNYKIEANQMDYIKTSKNIDFTPNVYEQEVQLFLDKKIIDKPKETIAVHEPVNPPDKSKIELKTTIRFGREVLDLPPVYFDLDQYYITKEAEYTVKKAIEIMALYPNLIIEFASHTDSRASDSYNLYLSNLRAKEVVDYMVKNGIDSGRLFGRGYGESKPVNKCIDGIKCSEAEHLENRRAEFVVISK